MAVRERKWWKISFQVRVPPYIDGGFSVERHYDTELMKSGTSSPMTVSGSAPVISSGSFPPRPANDPVVVSVSPQHRPPVVSFQLPPDDREQPEIRYGSIGSSPASLKIVSGTFSPAGNNRSIIGYYPTRGTEFDPAIYAASGTLIRS